MKWEDIKVCGHRRSGTHYITALISVNFLNNEKYPKIYEKHKTPDKLKVDKNKNILFIYVWRNFDDVSKSIFNMKNRFGINEDNFNKFLKKRYCDMFNGNQDVKVEVKTLTNRKVVKEVGGGLKNIKKTPYEYWKFDLDRWKRLKADNVILVCYDNIINNFEEEMKRIAKKINSNKTQFEDIRQRIGWKPMEDK